MLHLMVDACSTATARHTMLFKTHSASVYGIDAYRVEVEVDVGSAKMTDFNVVGLPDNVVQESRERIKSAMQNCGFEFPHGQGVTINLAPADVRKEGSAFDLLMAFGLVRCVGHFCWQGLGQMHVSGRVVAGWQRPFGARVPCRPRWPPGSSASRPLPSGNPTPVRPPMWEASTSSP